MKDNALLKSWEEAFKKGGELAPSEKKIGWWQLSGMVLLFVSMLLAYLGVRFNNTNLCLLVLLTSFFSIILFAAAPYLASEKFTKLSKNDRYQQYFDKLLNMSSFSTMDPVQQLESLEYLDSSVKKKKDSIQPGKMFFNYLDRIKQWRISRFITNFISITFGTSFVGVLLSLTKDFLTANKDKGKNYNLSHLQIVAISILLVILIISIILIFLVDQWSTKLYKWWILEQCISNKSITIKDQIYGLSFPSDVTKEV